MARLTRTTITTFLVVMLAATTLGLVPGVTPRADGAAEAAIEFSPTEGPTGTTITLGGTECFMPDGVTGADGVLVVLAAGVEEPVASTTVAVERDGTFAGELVIPAGVTAADYELRATCVSPELPALVEYTVETFTVTGEGEEAAPPVEGAAAPLAGGIEGYPSYDGQTNCSPSAKPGTSAFAANTLAVFTNTGTFGISRDCGIGGLSEHKEGRAWDWAADASNTAQHRSVDRMLRWLLATDADGNRHAMARRLGIMYIIWDRQMLRMYRIEDGWQPYSGSSPHTDHVHISFTRAGGNKTTSYWSMRNAPAWADTTSPPPTPTPPPRPSAPRAATFTQTRRDVSGVFTPIAGDFDGDGRDDILWYGKGRLPDYFWWGRGAGRFAGVKTNVARSYLPLSGDFDGDGRDDILWYGPGRGLDHIWWGAGNQRFTAQRLDIRGVYSPPVVGDFDGDGRDDVYWYGKGPRGDWLWWGEANRTFTGMATAANGVFRPPFADDFDGDGRDDIYWYGKGASADFMWHGNANRTFTGSYRDQPLARRPLVGNFNGDQRADILWYAPGAPQDSLWLGNRGRTFAGQAIANVSSDYRGAFVVDLDGNGRDDIYWYAPGAGRDYIWSF